MPRTGQKKINDLTNDEMNSIISHIELNENTVFDLCNTNRQFKNYCKNSQSFLKKAFDILKEKFSWIENERQSELNNLTQMEEHGIFDGQQYQVAYTISRLLREHFEAQFDYLEDFFTKNNYTYEELVNVRKLILLILKQMSYYYSGVLINVY
tara:strand:+ start:334 stop:792 length:459 start_codon:yes stop_codon:yes gene_type:complete